LSGYSWVGIDVVVGSAAPYKKLLLIGHSSILFERI